MARAPNTQHLRLYLEQLSQARYANAALGPKIHALPHGERG